MNKAVASVLNKVLGDWVRDLNSDQLNISLFQGEVSLQNLNLKENILHVLGLPFDLKHGSIGQITVKIPWSSVLSSPLTIEISDIFAFCTPKNPSSWSESDEKQAFEAGKRSSLNQFEVFMSAELNKNTSQTGGYFSEYATTIANNVQVKINNIYVRYEDSTSPFAIGLNLERLAIQTCNKNWQAEYINDCEITYKLIAIRNFSVYCDFNIQDCRIDENDISNSFKAVVNLEKSGENRHDYILKPFSFELKIVVSNRVDYNIPKAQCSFYSKAFKLNFDSGQIKVFFQLMKFLELYNNFKVGIIKNIKTLPIDQIKANYIEAYKTWRLEEVEVNKKKLEENLWKIEEMITVDDIRTLREEAVQCIEKRKTIDLKLKEIDSIRNEKEGVFSRFSGYFMRESQEEAEKKTKEKNERIEKVEQELKEIIESSSSSLTLSKSITEDEKVWDKFKVNFYLENGELTLADKSKILLSAGFQLFEVDLTVKLENLMVNMRMLNMGIRELIQDSPDYPHLLECSELSLSFNQNPMEIEVYCGDIYMCTIMVAIYKISSIFTKAASAHVDVSQYLNQANENISKKIEDGQSFLSSVITEPGPSKPFKLTLHLGAPRVIIPLRSDCKDTYMVIDLGKLNCITQTEEDKIGLFQKYKIHITDLQSYIVWNWEDIKDIQQQNKDFLLHPLRINTAFKKYLKVNYDKSGFILGSKFEEINLNINEKKIAFLIKLQGAMLDKQNMKEEKSVEKAMKKNMAQSLQNTNKNFKNNLAFMSVKNNLTKKLRERKSSIQHLKNAERIIPVEFSVVFKKIEVSLSELNEDLVKVSLEKLSVKVNMKQFGDVNGMVKVRVFRVVDLRKNSVYREIVSNPRFFVDLGEASPMINEVKKDKDYQLKVMIDYRPKQQYTDVGIVMSDLRFSLSKSFFLSLLIFYSNSISKFIPAQVPLEEKKSYFIVYNTNARYTINLKSIELWFITDNPANYIAHFNTSVMLTYSTRSECIYFYSETDKELKRNYRWCKEEADLTLSHLESYLIDPSNDYKKLKNIILPCRFSLEYSFDKHEATLCALVEVRLRIESICMHISITDLQFFKNLAEIWSGFPPNSGTHAKVSDKNAKKIVKSDFKALIDGDAVQVTIIDDTKKIPLSLFHVQISNLTGVFIDNIRGSDLNLEILMFIDYYNRSNGAWEPALEDWKFSFKYSFPLEQQKSFIVLQSYEVLNLNLTQMFVENLATFSKKLAQNQKISKKETGVGKVTKHGGLEYKVINKLGIPVYVWIKVSSNEDKKEITDNAFCFTQEYVDKLGRIENKILKKSSRMCEVSTPTKLGFSFNSDKIKSSEVIIDNVGIHIIKISSYSKFQFFCLINISIMEGQRIISFEPSVLLYNHSEHTISLTYLSESHNIQPMSSQNLPLNWSLHLDEVMLQDQSGPNLSTNSEFLTKDSFPLVVLIQKYKISPDHYLKVVEIAPEFFIKNLLNLPIRVCRVGTNEEVSIDIEEEIPFKLDKESLYQVQVMLNGKVLVTEKISLFNPKKVKCRFEGIRKSSILIDCQEKSFEKNQNLDKYSKELNESKCKSWTIRLHAEYIIVNQTEFDLDMSNLNIPAGGILFYSSKSNSKKLKLANIDSKYSSSFKIHTIGVSKAIKISQVKKNMKPKHYLLGVNISKAPVSLFLSKIIKIVPRFLIWNYLETPILVKQHNGTEPPSLIPEFSKSKSPLQFQFEDYDKSKFITISDSSYESTNESWSAPFQIEKIQDFQVKFASLPTEAEENMNVFMRGWHIPTQNNQNRYIRVYIHSQDEATIHIVLLQPKDPDFRIKNKTDRDLKVKQKKCPKIYDLDKDKSLPWVWDSFQKERKVQILSGKQMVTFDIENLSEKGKKFLGFKVYNQVNGVTRELIIEIPKEEEQGEVQVSEIVGSKMANAQKVKRVESLSQKNIKVKKAPSGLSLFNIIKTETKSKTSIWLKEIGITIIDKDNNEMLYLNFHTLAVKYRQKTSLMGQMGKYKTGISMKLEHFQIDYMGQKKKLFPVILFPVRRTKQVSNSNKGFGVLKEDLYYFFSFEMSKESNVRLKNGKEVGSIDKYSFLGVKIQDFQIKLNEEIIYLMLEIKDFFNCFYESGSEIVKDHKFDCFCTDTPCIPFELKSFQSKTYFNYVFIDGLSILITFKRANSDKKAGLRYDTGFFIDGLLKSLGGAFVNVSESPIAFKSLTLTHSFTTFNSFVSMLVSNYQNKGIQQFYKIFGSIDIIGNPLGLVGNITNGIYEFFTAPIRGLRSKEKGGFIKGVGKGIRSLLSGVIEGSFGSVSKITGSLYNVLRTATGEKILVHDIGTEQIGKKMAIGVKDCLLDITYGIGNIAIKPYKGASDSNIKGFFQGLLTGTFGLVTVPLKVVLKLSNVVTTTVASTSILLTKGKIQKYGRKRFPRQFGVKKILEPYNKDMAEAKELMKILCKGSLKREELVYFTRYELSQKSIILILTSNFVLYLEDEKLEGQVKIKSIIGMEIHVRKNLYFLGIATNKNKLVVAGGGYSALAAVYFAILSQNENLPSRDRYFFELPSYVVDEDLARLY